MGSGCRTSAKSGRATHEPNHISRPALIPDIEAFEERVAIHIHEGGIPNRPGQGPCSASPRLPQSGPLLGVAQGVCLTGSGWGRPPTKNQASLPERGAGYAFPFFCKEGLG